MKKVFYIFLAILFLACEDSVVNKAKGVSKKKIQARLDHLSEKAVVNVQSIPFDSLKIPRSGKKDGSTKATPSWSWTSGFYPGVLWHLYGYSKVESIKQSALQWQSPVEKEKFNKGDHDLGFKIFCSFGNAFKLTKKKEFQSIYVEAAKSLSTRFTSEVGAIRSWDHMKDLWEYPVIIDNMMNLELLFEATLATQDSSFYQIAYQHARTTLKNHFRKDNSSYHVIGYDPQTGSVLQKSTHQGYSDESAWSRGQAWGLYGFTVAYRYTRDEAFLVQAKKIAEFIFTHPNLPDDGIPYWDFDVPKIPNEPRDVSAAAVAASGLLELTTFDVENKDKYLKWADKILNSLEKPDYQSNIIPFILNQSVGSIPGKFEIADYYYVEALRRRLTLF